MCSFYASTVYKGDCTEVMAVLEVSGVATCCAQSRHRPNRQFSSVLLAGLIILGIEDCWIWRDGKVLRGIALAGIAGNQRLVGVVEESGCKGGEGRTIELITSC
ncbi:hypothetical protein GOP47_0006040 [Adiantum capillus-veneris]|uniref:Uncharacterized protein n=1 Tax=Adiantum capillus-veneris TaxID=13818 RepID=A0A9D4ZK11_ADICA|nr:hypothetical protein GOP47_0006040 [Adiantum capillus-veneris]